MSRLIAFLRRHIEVSAIVPVLLALLAGAWAITWYRGLPALNVSLAEAMAFSMPLAEPISVLTGAHVNAFLRAMHAERMEALLAPKPDAVDEGGAGE